MTLSSLHLKNFRNYSGIDLEFDPGFNFIFGNNAQGKTNLLEAIYFISYLKSFRTSTRDDLIANGTSQSLIEAKAIEKEISHHIRIVLESHSRQVQLNGKKPQLLNDYYGLLPVVLFEPSEVYLFRDSPSTRRRFIDRALFLDNPATLKTVREYEEVVSQKNKLLKEGFFQNDELEIWNDRLITLGAHLVYERMKWIEKMNHFLKEEYKSIAGEKEEARIVYKSSCHREEPERRRGDPGLDCFAPLAMTPSIEEISINLKNAIDQKREEELRRRETLVGPHRDDWILFLDERSLGDKGSQGENRSGVIALKSSQINLYRQTHQKTPIFLLDDVISELDSKRSEALLSALIQAHGQVFLTTTELSKMPNNFNNKRKTQGASFLVEEGLIRVLT